MLALSSAWWELMERPGAGARLVDGAVTAYTAFRHVLPLGPGGGAGADYQDKNGLVPGV